ncbi:MAG: ribosomal protein large subunit ribosomal protein [Candidatus Kaiserbacteria bacterium]|nr:ribosomal protein large subunit ribosomal protein [Candidatus Kaiserbacteria bacterium]
MTKIAIIETGGKQYVVTEGMVLDVETVADVQNAGDKITFENVLLTDDGSAIAIGAPYVKGAKVMGELVTHDRNKKVTVIKYREKSRYFKKKGHRQPISTIKITSL